MMILKTGGGLYDYVTNDFINSIKAVWGKRNAAGVSVPGAVSGAWSYELAANWRYYAGSLSTEGRDYEAVGVKGIDYVKRPGFAIDNIYKKDSYGNIIGLKFDFNL